MYKRKMRDHNKRTKIDQEKKKRTEKKYESSKNISSERTVKEKLEQKSVGRKRN